jgi:hypothetical protein
MRYFIILLLLFTTACSIKKPTENLGGFMNEVVRALEGLAGDKEPNANHEDDTEEWEEIDNDIEK